MLRDRLLKNKVIYPPCLRQVLTDQQFVIIYLFYNRIRLHFLILVVSRMVIVSVTRFGKISPLWRNCKSLCAVFGMDYPNKTE